VESPYVGGDEPPGSIKCWIFLDQLKNYWLLKKESVPWSQRGFFLPSPPKKKKLQENASKRLQVDSE